MQSWDSYTNGFVSESIVLARNAMKSLMPKPASNDNRWKFIYPLYYVDDLNHYASANNLNPALILSLVKEESHF